MVSKRIRKLEGRSDAALYSDFSAWFIQEAMRNDELFGLKPQGCRHYVILREDLDAFLDDLPEKAAA